jgi:hypothetical protein
MRTRANRHFEVITPFACGGRFFGPASALEPRIPAVPGPFWPPPAPGSRGSQKVRHMCTRWLVVCQVWPFFAHRRYRSSRYRSAEILHLPLFLCWRRHIFRRSFSAAPLERCSLSALDFANAAAPTAARTTPDLPRPPPRTPTARHSGAAARSRVSLARASALPSPDTPWAHRDAGAAGWLGRSRAIAPSIAASRTQPAHLSTRAA